MSEKELQLGDEVIVRQDLCYRHVVGRQGKIILANVLLEPKYVIVKIGDEVHAIQKKHLTKVR